MANLRRFWIATAAAIAVVYVVLLLDRAFGWWGGFGLDYSTHTAFVVAAGISLAVRDPRWLWCVVPAIAGYAWVMVGRGYHTVGDIVTTAAVIAPLAWACHRVARGRFSVG